MPDGTEATGIGSSVRRKEDYRYLTGQCNYTDDIHAAADYRAHLMMVMTRRAVANCS